MNALNNLILASMLIGCITCSAQPIMNDGIRTFTNLYTGNYLDIDGESGSVIIGPQSASGTQWRLTNQGNNIVTLQNLGNSRFKNYYLDIDGTTGGVILSSRIYSGAYWLVTERDGELTFKNQGNSRFKNYFLNADVSGNVILSSKYTDRSRWITLEGINEQVKSPLPSIDFEQCLKMFKDAGSDYPGEKCTSCQYTGPNKITKICIRPDGLRVSYSLHL